MHKHEGYIAGKLFKKADQVQRIYEKERLSEEIITVNFFNPLTDNPDNDKSKLPTAADIFNGDTQKVVDSKFMVAELDDEDPGVMMELGIAYGINYVLDFISDMLQQGFSEGLILDVLIKKIPYKEVFAHLSDLRLGTTGEYDGKYVPFGYNQFVIGGVEQMGTIYNSFEDVVEALKAREAREDGI